MKYGSVLLMAVMLGTSAFYMNAFEKNLRASIKNMEDSDLKTKEALLSLMSTVDELKTKIEQKPKVVYKTKIVTKLIKPDNEGYSVGVCGFPDRPDKANRLMLGMGAGPNGLSVSSQQRTVKQKTGTILGIDYERKTNSGNVLGVGFGSNKSVMIKLGRDF